MGDMFKYLIIMALIAAAFSTAGILLFGLAAVTALIVGALIGIFIPAIIVIVALAIMGLTLLGRVPFIMGTVFTVALLVVAGFIADMAGGGL